MLSVTDTSGVIQSVFRIGSVANPNLIIGDTIDLRNGFHAFLKQAQPDIPVNSRLDPFIVDSDDQKKLSAAFMKGALNDLNQADVVGEHYTYETLCLKTAKVRTALNSLLSMDENFAFQFSLVIHSIFVRQSKPDSNVLKSHGGSSSASIGCIWLAVDDETTHWDIIEMLVHELTHHLMFIDELCRPQFIYSEIIEKRNFAFSAILKKYRPLDKVVHSIVVASSVIEARRNFLNRHERTLVHPTTNQLCADTIVAIDSVFALENVEDLITAHSKRLLDECYQICKLQEQTLASTI